jgi:hypothetical protein
VTAHRFYDDYRLARLLPPDLFLVVAPATFRFSLFNWYVFEKVGSDCWAPVSVREQLSIAVVSAEVRFLG